MSSCYTMISINVVYCPSVIAHPRASWQTFVPQPVKRTVDMLITICNIIARGKKICNWLRNYFLWVFRRNIATLFLIQAIKYFVPIYCLYSNQSIWKVKSNLLLSKPIFDPNVLSIFTICASIKSVLQVKGM